MSDVLHHARLTPTEQGMVGRRMRFLADINAKAFKPTVVIPIAEIQKVAAPHVSKWVSPEELAFGPIVLPQATETILPTCAEIVKATAKYFGVPKIEMLSNRRQSDITRARHIAIYLCSVLTLRSTPFIGRQIGDRDHTTVISAIRKIQGELLAGKTVTVEAVDTLIAQFGVDL